jgi:hypothetical protein
MEGVLSTAAATAIQIQALYVQACSLPHHQTLNKAQHSSAESSSACALLILQAEVRVNTAALLAHAQCTARIPPRVLLVHKNLSKPPIRNPIPAACSSNCLLITIQARVTCHGALCLITPPVVKTPDKSSMPDCIELVKKQQPPNIRHDTWNPELCKQTTPLSYKHCV